ncbi:hypothetical protein [Mycobacteroides chelonae]|uniref:hypothetical protein n=1 Tax=Mycobacteroides chelonae TaxID=1774 RepID=UPI0008A9A5F9|nr:hypothetical protein [Mycobacteroides chelonae]OHU48758.1 hypothetical protein BKG81_15115 [Mycobacteroides chelonae]
MSEAAASDMARTSDSRWPVVVAAFALIIGIAILISGVTCAVTVRRPPLRAIAAAQDMPDDMARPIATSTIRLWVQARNNRDMPAIQQLICGKTGKTLSVDIKDLTEGNMVGIADVAGFGAFGKYPDGKWYQIVLFKRSDRGLYGRVFIFQVEDGGLHICDFVSMRQAGMV